MSQKNTSSKIEPKVPRQVKSRMVKDSILAAAAELIKENGYEYVTVNNICTIAGVSVGSFYHHFENKDQLLAYYLVAAFEERSQEVSSFPTDDVVEFVLRCHCLYEDFLLEQGFDFIKNYFTSQNKGLDTYTTKNDPKVIPPASSKTKELFTKAIQAGDMRPSTDPNLLYEDLCIIQKGIIFDWCLCSAAYDLKKQTRRILKQYLESFMTEKYFQRLS